MPDQFIRVAQDGTGAKLHTRERTVGADVVQEQYVIPIGERVVLSRVWYSTFRTPIQASTSHALFTCYNTGTNPITVRRLSVEVDSIAASALVSPWLRLYRLAGTAPTGGAAVVGVQQDTGDPAINAGVVVRQAATADASTSAITAATGVTGPMWAQVVPRWQTLVGYQSVPVMNLLPDDAELNREDPLILRTNQGFLVRAEAAAAPAAGAWQFMFKTVLGEYTLP